MFVPATRSQRDETLTKCNRLIEPIVSFIKYLSERVLLASRAGQRLALMSAFHPFRTSDSDVRTSLNRFSSYSFLGAHSGTGKLPILKFLPALVFDPSRFAHVLKVAAYIARLREIETADALSGLGVSVVLHIPDQAVPPCLALSIRNGPRVRNGGSQARLSAMGGKQTLALAMMCTKSSNPAPPERQANDAHGDCNHGPGNQ